MTFDRKMKCIRYTDVAYDLRESDAFSTGAARGGPRLGFQYVELDTN